MVVPELKQRDVFCGCAYPSLQRDAATAPTVGDRVPYVIIKAAKGAKVSHDSSGLLWSYLKMLVSY